MQKPRLTDRTAEALLNEVAAYLDKLHGNLIANDADMMIDKCESPGMWADKIRSALCKDQD